MDDRSHVSDRLRRVASRYEATVSHGRAEQLAARAMARAQRVPRRHHRVAAAVVGSAFTIVVLSGLALAAESAVPGDLLYPVDRAVEALGLDRNLLEERLEEAIILADRGDRDRVVVIAGEVLDEVNRSGVQVVRTPLPLVTVMPEADESDAGKVQAAPATSNPRTVDSAEVAPTTAVPADQSTGEVLALQDPVAMIRLEAENLLRTVRQAKSDPTALDALGLAAGSLADAIDAAATSTSPTSSTTTTAPAVSTSTSTSSTTSSTSPTSSTTSTTVEGDGGGDNGSEPGDGDGSGSGNQQPPITLPQP